MVVVSLNSQSLSFVSPLILLKNETSFDFYELLLSSSIESQTAGLDPSVKQRLNKYLIAHSTV